MDSKQNRCARPSPYPLLRRRDALGLGVATVSASVLAACAGREPAGDAVGAVLQGPGAIAGGAAAAAGATAAGSSAVASGASGGKSAPAAPAPIGGNSASAGGSGGAAPAGAAGRAPSPPLSPAATAGKGGTGATDGTGGRVSAGSDLVVPAFPDIMTCTLTPTDRAGEGPFFIHEDEVMDDPALFRVDMRDGRPGVEFQLHIRVLDQDSGCMAPIANTEVYVWHTDALGFYSGFDGQDPNQVYRGGLDRTVQNADRFCRGAQVTNEAGIVSFRTLYPGWYFGRGLHMHFLALRKGSGPATMSYRGEQYHVFTTQFYFDPAFSRMIHENNDPYKTRASGMGYERYVEPESEVRPVLELAGNVVIGTATIITSATESRG